jgi:hypothetical protein
VRLLHGIPPVHTAAVREFGVTELKHLPYSSDLTELMGEEI